MKKYLLFLIVVLGLAACGGAVLYGVVTWLFGIPEMRRLVVIVGARINR